MNDELKAVRNLGAELGAAKAENDRLRGLLDGVRKLTKSQRMDNLVWSMHEGRIKAALSHQPKPTETYTAVEMATAAAQGFRDGQAAVEQATAKDEREAVLVVGYAYNLESGVYSQYPGEDWSALMTVAQHESIVAALTRPAQTEHPVAWLIDWAEEPELGHYFSDGPNEHARSRPLYAAPIAQTAPQGKFRMGDPVKKSTGSEWEGRICGTYSTALTPEGYAVESKAHKGSVQIYPAKALEAVE